MKMVGIIIILVLILTIVLLAIGLVIYVKNKLSIFSKQFLGTEDIVEGFKKQEKEYSETPKSLSNLELVLTPRITEDFPTVNIDELKRVATYSITSYYNSLDTRRVENNEYFTDKLKNELEIKIQNNKSSYKNLKIHRTVIKDYQNSTGRCIITFQSAIEYVKDGKKYQQRINSDFVYVYDDAGIKDGLGISLNCPNCGAGVRGLAHKACPYCGSGIVDIVTKTWKFNDLQEI